MATDNLDRMKAAILKRIEDRGYAVISDMMRGGNTDTHRARNARVMAAFLDMESSATIKPTVMNPSRYVLASDPRALSAADRLQAARDSFNKEYSRAMRVIEAAQADIRFAREILDGATVAASVANDAANARGDK